MPKVTSILNFSVIILVNLYFALLQFLSILSLQNKIINFGMHFSEKYLLMNNLCDSFILTVFFKSYLILFYFEKINHKIIVL